MNERIPYQRWLNNPERRVGRLQLLLTRAAAVVTGDCHHGEYKEPRGTERRRPVRKAAGQ